jgi:hypothetical protein
MTREDRGASSFDELAVGLSSGTLSRSKALKLMGAALVGGTLASLGIGEASAVPRCKPAGKRCKNGTQCCSGQCVDRVCGEVAPPPICTPPCQEGSVCTAGPGGVPTCQPRCTPSCRRECGCFRDADGSGSLCADRSILVESCDECPHPNLPGSTNCINLSILPGAVVPACALPCP